MRAFDMSRYVRVIATEGRVRGEFAVHGTDRGVFKIEPIDVVLFDEDRSWGLICRSGDFDVDVSDRDEERRTPRLGRRLNPEKAANIEEFRELIDAVLPLVVKAWELGVGSIVDESDHSIPTEETR